MVNILNVLTSFLMMLILQMMLKLLWVVCFLLCVCFSFKVIVLSSLPLLCTQRVLLGGVFMSPIFCSSFTQQLQAPRQLIGTTGIVKVRIIFLLLLFYLPQEST